MADADDESTDVGFAGWVQEIARLTRERDELRAELKALGVRHGEAIEAMIASRRRLSAAEVERELWRYLAIEAFMAWAAAATLDLQRAMSDIRVAMRDKP